MGGTTNIMMEESPCAILNPLSPKNIKIAAMTTPIKLLINKMMRNSRILIPMDCFKFSVKKSSFIVFDFCAKIHFL